VQNFPTRRKLRLPNWYLNDSWIKLGENCMLKGVLVGIFLGILLVFVGVYFYFSSGHAPVATKAPEMPFEHKFAHIAQDAYLEKLPHLQPAVPEDEKNFLEGAKVYKDNCAVCHGLPGEPKTSIADGMFPPPPQLFRGTGVTDDETWETYWKVSGGIRMTGMPGFNDHLGETKMWQVSVLLKNADKISPAVKAELTSSAATITTPPVQPLPLPNAAPATTVPPAYTTTPPAHN
jgi:thiosulfate dehydrogenase